MIRLLTKKDGKVVIDKVAKEGVNVCEVQEIAENEFYGGYADYVRVDVDGKVYTELEA